MLRLALREQTAPLGNRPAPHRKWGCGAGQQTLPAAAPSSAVLVLRQPEPRPIGNRAGQHSSRRVLYQAAGSLSSNYYRYESYICGRGPELSHIWLPNHIWGCMRPVFRVSHIWLPHQIWGSRCPGGGWAPEGLEQLVPQLGKGPQHVLPVRGPQPRGRLLPPPLQVPAPAQPRVPGGRCRRVPITRAPPPPVEDGYKACNNVRCDRIASHSRQLLAQP